MKKLLLLNSAFLILRSVLLAQSPDWLWAKGMGGTDDDYGTSIAIDASGNVYTTGGFTGIADFDPGAGVFNLTSAGSNDIFISKLDASGNFVWAKTMGGASDEHVMSVALDATGNVHTTGFFSSTADFDPGTGVYNLTSAGSNDIFISKLDSLGNFIWVKRMGGSGNGSQGWSIDLDVFGNVYTTGIFYATVDFDPGAGTFNLTSSGVPDGFISKLDSSGNFVWAKRFGGTGYIGSTSIVVTTSGNIYTSGYFAGTVDFDPGAGTFNLTGTGYMDIFISKLDASGNFVWSKAMGGTGNDFGNSLALDASGNVYTTGSFQGTADFDPGVGVFNLSADSSWSDIFISKLDVSGNFVWAKAMGGIETDNGQSIALDASGNVYTTGFFAGTVDFDPGAGTFNLTGTGYRNTFISKFDTSGNIVWAKAVVGTHYLLSNFITPDASSNVYVTGRFNGPLISFDATTLTNSGSINSFDIFIAKLDTAIITGNNEIENLNNSILLFPNPANNHLTIVLGSSNKKVELTITDITGKIIYKTIARETLKIDLSIKDFAEGIYLVQIKSAEFLATEKLIVSRE